VITGAQKSTAFHAAGPSAVQREQMCGARILVIFHILVKQLPAGAVLLRPDIAH
jgi:hypothetical protein